jgi:N-methylhydantoinase B
MHAGIDIGGTFTDAVVVDGTRAWRGKALTTHDDLAAGSLAALAAACGTGRLDSGRVLASVTRLSLGTTAVTNVLASRTGVRVGLITTAGFEDAIPLAKGRRLSEGGRTVLPAPVVDRQCIVGVPERVDRNGVVHVPLDVAAVERAADLLVREKGCEAIVVSFVWAFKSPKHEQLAVDAVRDLLPSIPVFGAAELSPIVREFERTSHAVLTAYVSRVAGAIGDIERSFRSAGLRAPLVLVHSAGGSVSASEVASQPVGLASSGPAAGVFAAAQVAARVGIAQAVTFDMGGTTLDCAVVSEGAPLRVIRGDVGGLWTSLARVEVSSLGAGGGSIGWIDDRGSLRVGPQSAGSVPGPACYGRGGTDVTVTDALVVLGLIDPSSTVGGVVVDRQAGADACRRLAEQLGTTPVHVAWGMRAIVIEATSQQIRSLVRSRGMTTEDLALVSFGGCGGLFAVDVAAAVGIGTVVCPFESSVLSAAGAASAPIKRERSRSSTTASDDEVAAVLAELTTAVLADVARDGVAADAVTLDFEGDFRLRHQIYELPIPLYLTDGIPDLDDAAGRFHVMYRARYGAGSLMMGAEPELSTLRVIATEREAPGDAAEHEPGRVGDAGEAREVIVDHHGTMASVQSTGASDLRSGSILAGPVLVDLGDTTIWLPSGAVGEVRSGCLIVTVPLDAPPAAPDVDGSDGLVAELVRARLEGIAADAAATIERTAISPVVTESKDYSATLLDADGNLLAGGGEVSYHWLCASRAVGATIDRFGDEAIVDGDVFLVSDPHNGGGLHPNDVFVQRPVFVDGARVAWVALSAHLIDVGGMAFGSFAPAATDCYQEAVRVPPVRLIAESREVSDVWDLFLNNVRLRPLVEADLRALVAGSHVAERQLVNAIRRTGTDTFAVACRRLRDLSDRGLRRRIAELEDGAYTASTWAEWDDELYELRCCLRVEGDELTFDFTGAPPQTSHFFNSKQYIIESAMLMQMRWAFAADLPYSEGLRRAIHVVCPPGSILDCEPPAPVAAAHIHVALNAAEVAMRCLDLATWASTSRRVPVTGGSSLSAIGTSVWAGLGADGAPFAYVFMDGQWSGASAACDGDGLDWSQAPFESERPPATIDIEILEDLYPLLIVHRRVRPGVNGAGRFRSGGGCDCAFRPLTDGPLIGQMLGMRERIPISGIAGGRPGARTEFAIRGDDGATRAVPTNAANVPLSSSEAFQFSVGSGGGFGDPLDRWPHAVVDDVALGRLTPAEARSHHGVILTDCGDADLAATSAERDGQRAARLMAADPPRTPTGDRALLVDLSDARELYPNVWTVSGVAYAGFSGAPLGVAPGHWTDGCPVLIEPLGDVRVVSRAYLDPITGAALAVEAVPAAASRSFSSEPSWWLAGDR